MVGKEKVSTFAIVSSRRESENGSIEKERISPHAENNMIERRKLRKFAFNSKRNISDFVIVFNVSGR